MLVLNCDVRLRQHQQTEGKAMDETTILDEPPDQERRAPLALPGQVAFCLVDSFLADKGEHTRRAYADDLAAFASFYDQPDAETGCRLFVQLGNGAANSLLLNWKADLMRRGLSAASINRKLAALRSLTKHARRLGLSQLCVDVPGMKRQGYRDT